MDTNSENTCKVLHLIVDSAGFLKDAPLKDIGRNVYTIEQVVSEIRDRATRSRLQVLPYELLFRTPSAEAIKFVTEFSKKTGDYATLSPVDLKVIALTFQLHKEHGDASQIKYEPSKNVQIEAKSKNIATPKGFYFEKNDKKEINADNNKELQKDTSSDNELNDEGTIDASDDEINCGDGNDDDEEWYSSEEIPNDDEFYNTIENSDQNIENEEDDVDEALNENINDDENLNEDDIDDDEKLNEEDIDDDEKLNEDDIDDDEGWITPKNIASMKKGSSTQSNVNTDPIQVACLTTDFAMQNVLIQMGLSIVSLDGMVIKHARNYVLKCSACFKVTKDMTKVFCHHCGNQTLQKVSMTVKEDGSVVYHMNNRRQANIRGLRYALPTPKGGKNAHNPILFPDQMKTKGRGRSSKKFNTDLISDEQPFSLHTLNSKGSKQASKQWDVQPTVGRRKNPNVNQKCKAKR